MRLPRTALLVLAVVGLVLLAGCAGPGGDAGNETDNETDGAVVNDTGDEDGAMANDTGEEDGAMAGDTEEDDALNETDGNDTGIGAMNETGNETAAVGA